MKMSTFLLYAGPVQVESRDPGTAILRLRQLGVRLTRLDDEVLVAEGPTAFFTETNRRCLQRRARALCAYLFEQQADESHSNVSSAAADPDGNIRPA